MAQFVEYKSDPFSGLSNAKQTLVEVDEHNIEVTRITITNLGEEDIRINLKFVRTSLLSGTETFLTYNFLVPNYNSPREYKGKVIFNTVELVKLLGIGKTLEYNDDYTDSLVCYSNGYTQKFDCTVDYCVLNDLPTPLG